MPETKQGGSRLPYVSVRTAAPLSMYGDGSDGALDFDGTSVVAGLTPAMGVYLLERPLYGTTVRLRDSAAWAVIAGARVYARDSALIEGVINADGLPGNNAVADAGGASLPTIYGDVCSVATSLAGKAGGANAGTGAAAAYTAVRMHGKVMGIGGDGGSGGAGTGGVGGTAATSAAGCVPSRAPSRTWAWLDGSLNVTHGSAASGAGGGGNGAQKGGGGGGAGQPGGMVVLCSPTIVLASTALLTAAGGAGGNGAAGTASNCGGGGGAGGAGGGCFVLAYDALTEVSGSSIVVDGGAAGSGGASGGGSGVAGSDGGAGGAGFVYRMCRTSGVITVA